MLASLSSALREIVEALVRRLDEIPWTAVSANAVQKFVRDIKDDWVLAAATVAIVLAAFVAIFLYWRHRRKS